MEHVMQVCAQRQLELVGNIADVFDHLERAVLLRLRLAFALDVQRSHPPMKQPQPGQPQTRAHGGCGHSTSCTVAVHEPAAHKSP
jgi:hypothetical protein